MKFKLNTKAMLIVMLGLLALIIVSENSFLLAQNNGEEVTISEEPTTPNQLDATAGGEQSIPTQSLWDMLIAGGPLLIPIVVCSIIFLVFVFERFISLRRGNVIPKPFVKRFMQQLEEGQLTQKTALPLCDENKSAVAKVLAAAVKKWGRASGEVEQAIIDAGERVSNDLRRYLRVINGVATVSPLLGLLGTVWGMMQAFNAIATAEALGRPALLASGISQALLTTAAGLFVAIPALIAYMFFSGRVDQLIIEIDALGQEVTELISADALKDGGTSKSTARRTKAA